MEKIIVGSRAFFSGIDGFTPGSTDYVELIENPEKFEWRHELSMRGVNTYSYKKEASDVMVQRTLDYGNPLLVGKFLVPAVAEAIGLTVADLQPLEPLLDDLEEKHRYIKTIYEAVKANGSFSLTDEQRAAAFEEYSKTRAYKSDRVTFKGIRPDDTATPETPQEE